MSTDTLLLTGNADPNLLESTSIGKPRGVRNAGAPQEPRLNYISYQTVESIKIKTSLSSACSRGPAPKLQVTKVLPSEYMAIAHTGERDGPGVGRQPRLHTTFLNRLPGHPRQAAKDTKPTRWRVGP